MTPVTLNKREKILAAVVGGLLALVGGFFVYRIASGPLAERRSAVNAVAEQVRDKQSQAETAEKTAARLADLNRRSLPAQPQDARRLYQTWLLELTDQIKLRRAKVESSEPQVRRVVNQQGRARAGAKPVGKASQEDMFYQFPFVVRGQGTLEQLTAFLHRFYSVGYLHQIRHISVKPADGGDLELVLSVDALSLPGAEQKDKLVPLPGGRVTAEMAEYRKAIVDRNLFAPYKPPAVVAEKPKARSAEPPRAVTPFDPARHTYVTGIVNVGETAYAWLHVRPKNEILKLRLGEKFEVGTLKGTIARIGAREVEIEGSDGKRFVVAQGDPLRSDATKTP